jgi:hypothetical protein
MAEQKVVMAKSDEQVDITMAERQMNVDARLATANAARRAHMREPMIEPSAVLSIIMDCADAQECDAPPYTTQFSYHSYDRCDECLSVLQYRNALLLNARDLHLVMPTEDVIIPPWTRVIWDGNHRLGGLHDLQAHPDTSTDQEEMEAVGHTHEGIDQTFSRMAGN